MGWKLGTDEGSGTDGGSGIDEGPTHKNIEILDTIKLFSS